MYESFPDSSLICLMQQPVCCGSFLLILAQKKTPIISNGSFLRAFQGSVCSLALLALLVCNGAGSLASGLAGSLALAAAAVSSAVLESRTIQRLDMLHVLFPPRHSIVL
jgi:hypothetical protein